MNQSPKSVLKIDDVRIEYESLVAVDGVSFTLEAGLILGLLGPNGAGKTSLMKAIAGLNEMTHGQIEINGYSLETQRAQAIGCLGFQPDHPPYYEDLTVYEFLELFASAYGVLPDLRKKRIETLVELVNLSSHLHHPTGGLSRGMKQRIFLAKTLIPDPPVLMLDEPASGLDPVARQEFTQLLKTLAQEGKSIILSSHILEELNTVCDSLCVMVKGKLIDFGRVEEVRGRLKPNLAIDLSFKPKESIQIETYFRTHLFPKYPLLQLIESRTHAGFKEAQHFRLEIKSDAEETDYPQFLNQLLNELAQSNLGLFHFNLQEANLQDLFLHLSKGVN